MELEIGGMLKTILALSENRLFSSIRGVLYFPRSDSLLPPLVISYWVQQGSL
jgi:hypothetical protein